MPRKKEFYICDICGIDSNEMKVYRTEKFGETMYLCQRHYYQMNTHGEIKRNMYDPNEIIEHENHLEIILYDKNIEISGSTLVSKQHRELIENYKWSKVKDGKTYYSQAYDGKGKFIKLHQLIAKELYGECPENQSVDHKNRDGLDNRDENLSYKNYSEQMWNRGILKSNTSGTTGVHFEKPFSLWFATIRSKGKRYKKGFKNKEDAIAQRKTWEEQRYKGEL